MARKKKNPAAGDALARAIANAELQFGGEEREIRGAIADTDAETAQNIKIARNTGNQLGAAAAAGVPTIRGVYSQAGQGAAAQQAFVDKMIGPGVNAPGSALAGAIARDRVQAANNRGMQEAAAVTAQLDKADQHRKGGEYGAAQAKRQGEQKKLKLLETLQGILHDKGLATQKNLSDEIDKQYQRDLDAAKFQLDQDKFQHQLDKDAADAAGKGGPSESDRKSARKLFEQQIGSIKSAGGLSTGRTVLDNATGEKKPVVWTLAQAKQGINKAGKKTTKAKALREFERTLANALQPKSDTLLARAVAQTYVWGGVGPNTFAAVYERYGLKLPQFKRK